MVDKKIIAVIPARSGSTRIKDKNIYPFMGKPLMAWSIEAALETKMFDRIIVSTDSPKYAEIAKEYGAEAPFLRDKYSDNASSCAMVCLYATEQAEKYYNETYNTIVMLQTTCPLRDSRDIKNSLDFYLNNNVKMLMSATQYTMNPWWGATLDENKKPNFVLYSPEQCPSQSKPPMYCPNGAIAIMDKTTLKATGKLYTDDLRFYEMDWKNSIDIDNYEDIEIAEALYPILKKVTNV